MVDLVNRHADDVGGAVPGHGPHDDPSRDSALEPARDAMPPDRARRKLKRDFLRIAFVVLFFVGVAIVLHDDRVQAELFDIEHLRERMDGHGLQGFALFFGIAALLTGVGMPRIWACAAGGALYGAWEGVLISHFATLFGATINFLFARWVLRGPIKRRFLHNRPHWQQRFADNGFRYILYARLFPLGNATVLNLICGASRVKYLHFLAATFIGYLPFTLTFALFGSSAAKRQPIQLALAAALLTSVFVGRWWWRRRQRVARESAPLPA